MHGYVTASKVVKVIRNKASDQVPGQSFFLFFLLACAKNTMQAGGNYIYIYILI